VLRLEKAALLQGTCLTVLTFRHIEDDSMGVKLRRSITIYGTGRVVLERGGNEFSGRLWRMNVADARLG
jgi:hypothetical protein